MSRVVRPATAADAEAIARLHVVTWQAAYAGLLPAAYLAAMPESVEQRAERWRTTVATATATVLVVDAQGTGPQLAGFAALGACRDDDSADHTGELYAIYVDPGQWAVGVGSALHDAGLASLVAAGNTTATLWVLDTNQQARAFYERHGWSPDGSTKPLEIGDVTVNEVRYSTHLVG
jgi:ribosomal protein S18 acetylase RimI-like enzyme